MGLYVLLDRIPKTCKLLNITLLSQEKVSYSSHMGFESFDARKPDCCTRTTKAETSQCVCLV